MKSWTGGAAAGFAIGAITVLAFGQIAVGIGAALAALVFAVLTVAASL